MPTDYAGNNLSAAKNLSVNANTQILKDWVGTTDLNDFYRFTLTNRSSFNLGLDGLSANADVQLLDSSGNLLQQSSNSSTAAESLGSLLSAGTYYLRVYSSSGENTNYNLLVSAKTDLAGNTLDTARTISVGTTTRIYSESISTNIDPEDYYRFTVNTASDVHLILEGLSSYAESFLLDSYGNQINSSYGYSGAPAIIDSLLKAGTYYIKIAASDPLAITTNYDLRIISTPDLAGNTLDTARAIALTPATKVYSDYANVLSDADDYYRFTLNTASIFNLSLEVDGCGAGYALLFDGNGNQMGWPTWQGTAATFNQRLAAGTYYINVGSYYTSIGAYSSYELLVSATPDLAGNYFDSARAIALGSTTRAYSESIGGQADPEDYYRFTLNAASAFNLTINGLNGGEINLIDSNGNWLEWANWNGSSATINKLLAAGTYYIRIAASSYYETAANYEMLVSAAPDLAGNYFNTARAIALSPAARVYSESIGGQSDTYDLYRFTLNSASAFKLNISGLSANASVRLLDSNNNWVAWASDSGSERNIYELLAAGTYYIGIDSPDLISSIYEMQVAATPDLAGNATGTARAIAIGSTTAIYADSIGGYGGQDPEDFYRFTLNAASNFNLKLNLDGSNSNVDVAVFNDSGTWIYGSNNGIPDSKTIQSLLAAGTYYIRVNSFSGANNNYELQVAAVPNSTVNNSVTPDLAGNSFGTARAIALSPTTRIYAESIGNQDQEDYYRFTVNTASSFNLTLNGVGTNGYVDLFNSNGSGVNAYSYDVYGESISLNAMLAAGTYYIKVTSFDLASKRYELGVSGDPDLAGSDLGTARAIALSSTTAIYSESIGKLDERDYYRFALNTAGYFSLAVNGLNGGSADLLDSYGNYYTSSSGGGGKINSWLAAGTYYIAVNSFASWTENYDLQMAVVPDLAGNNFNTAKAIALSPATTIYSDSIGGQADSEDYYRFTLNAASNFNLTVDGLNNANLELLDSNGNLSGWTKWNGSSATIDRYLAAGTYYIRIDSFSGARRYEMRVSAAPDLAGNNFDTARAIALSPASTIYSESVGQFDSEDYYRFTLNSASALNLNLIGLGASADVELFDSNGNWVYSPSNYNGESIDLNTSLAAGTYYLKVTSFDNASRNYDLRVSAAPDLAGNDFPTARAIAVGSTATTYSESIGTASDDRDLYRFTLNQTSLFKLTFDNYSMPYARCLYDSSGNALPDQNYYYDIGVYPYNGRYSTLTSVLAAGTYYVGIFPTSWERIGYNFQVSATPEIAGNTLDTARTINVSPTVQTYSESIGSIANIDDFYRFNLSSDANFNLVLDGLSVDVSVQLIDNNGNIIKDSYNGGTLDESISQFLAAGTYYIRVSPTYLGNEAITNYNLRVFTS